MPDHAQVEAKLAEGLEGLWQYLDPEQTGLFALATQLLRLQNHETWSITRDKVHEEVYGRKRDARVVNVSVTGIGTRSSEPQGSPRTGCRLLPPKRNLTSRVTLGRGRYLKDNPLVMTVQVAESELPITLEISRHAPVTFRVSSTDSGPRTHQLDTTTLAQAGRRIDILIEKCGQDTGLDEKMVADFCLYVLRFMISTGPALVHDKLLLSTLLTRCVTPLKRPPPIVTRDVTEGLLFRGGRAGGRKKRRSKTHKTSKRKEKKKERATRERERGSCL